MIGTIVYQLTRNMTPEQIKASGYDSYFVNHTNGVYPADSNGTPYTAASMQVKGDPITDIHEDLAAEQKARSTYDNILRFADDPDVRDPIKFLRAREVVHYQRFGETKRTKGYIVSYIKFSGLYIKAEKTAGRENSSCCFFFLG